jgi:GNAT superfamily N-acetyltransferase
LHVLEEYRRKGIARVLLLEIIRRVQDLGIMPFTYVEPENCPSLILVNSLGFIPDRIVHWVNINR